MSRLTTETISDWLQQLGIEFSLCQHCDGLHINLVTELNGVFDCKVELLDSDLYWVTAIEVAPQDLFQIQANLGPLSINYAELKFFIELDNTELPRLLCMNTLFTESGDISQAQFNYWVNRLIRQTTLAVQDLDAQALASDTNEIVSASSSSILH
ncbi:hypothetical protein [Paraferrimonas haliotis]|uniref:Sensory transduction regulator n=1 Tax=Paraferrimonas haliotis TaxID=2013866 RepID=A0AA37TMX2_9GAMM|nr:hypothetical protein [Paraferrimonas haliotis]GLS84674.1 hypothetical protein GCM10007894_26510 [Paraferrimonas haliotis]